MTDGVLFALTLATALGCGLMAGTFFAFSVFVMEALRRLPAAQGIAAMQSINVAVINPWFMGIFLGTAGLCVLALIAAVVTWEAPGSICILAGSALYFLGCIGVTMGFNVPLNNALAAAVPNSDEAAGLWRRYLRDWTWWNHVRTIGCLAATAAFTIALR
jgi:uncharacterized membrane protein